MQCVGDTRLSWVFHGGLWRVTSCHKGQLKPVHSLQGWGREPRLQLHVNRYISGKFIFTGHENSLVGTLSFFRNKGKNRIFSLELRVRQQRISVKHLTKYWIGDGQQMTKVQHKRGQMSGLTDHFFFSTKDDYWVTMLLDPALLSLLATTQQPFPANCNIQ